MAGDLRVRSRGRGHVPVERYQAAAELYGYIVAGSNNSPNESRRFPRILAAMTLMSPRPSCREQEGLPGGHVGWRACCDGGRAGVEPCGRVIASSAGIRTELRKTVSVRLFVTAELTISTISKCALWTVRSTRPTASPCSKEAMFGCRVSLPCRLLSGWSFMR